MRKCFHAIVVGTLLLAARPTYADTVSVGDLLQFMGSDGNLDGGAFTVDDTSNGFEFKTFCVQVSQYIDYSNLFSVGSITDYADDASGNNYMTQETDWIYSAYSRGLLDGTYTTDEIQTAIWELQNEVFSDYQNSAALIALAQNAVAGGWTNDGVHVLNLFYPDGTPAQDQLIYTPPVAQPVPEPGSMMLLGTGLLGFARLARSRRRQGT